METTKVNQHAEYILQASFPHATIERKPRAVGWKPILFVTFPEGTLKYIEITTSSKVSHPELCLYSASSWVEVGEFHNADHIFTTFSIEELTEKIQAYVKQFNKQP